MARSLLFSLNSADLKSAANKTWYRFAWSCKAGCVWLLRRSSTAYSAMLPWVISLWYFPAGKNLQPVWYQCYLLWVTGIQHVSNIRQTCLSTWSLMALPSVNSSNPHFSGKSKKSSRPGTPYTEPTSGERYAWGGNMDVHALRCNVMMEPCNLEVLCTCCSQTYL